MKVTSKKWFKRMLGVSMAAVLVAAAAFVGCTPTPKEDSKEEDPLKVSGGEVTKGGGAGYANAVVTAANLNDFIVAFCSALDSYYRDNHSESGNAQRSKREDRPPEYGKESEIWKGSYKKSGDSSGYVEITKEDGGIGEWTSTSESGSEFENKTYKFFNFSNTNELFLGGAVGTIWKEEWKNDIFNLTEKCNGSINFKGAYDGKVVFDNLSHVAEYRYVEDHDHDEDGNCMHDTIKTTKGGYFYVESGGKKIDLPLSSLDDFLYPYSHKDRDYGNGEITLVRPSAVPTAPSGKLTERSGTNAAVSADKVIAFFAAFMAELGGNEYGDNNRTPRAVNEETENWEELEHGKFSGYILKKGDWKSQENNKGEYSAGTGTTAYNDYSNSGRLYFGGGYGKLEFGFYKYTDNPYSYVNKDTVTINGTVKFNGEFKGELSFQNFKFEYNSSDYSSDEYKLIGGSVKIGSINVTTEYVKYVLKRERIVDPSVGGVVVLYNGVAPTADNEYWIIEAELWEKGSDMDKRIKKYSAEDDDFWLEYGEGIVFQNLPVNANYFVKAADFDWLLEESFEFISQAFQAKSDTTYVAYKRIGSSFTLQTGDEARPSYRLDYPYKASGAVAGQIRANKTTDRKTFVIRKLPEITKGVRK